MKQGERQEGNFKRINILSHNVPAIHSPEHFDIEKYDVKYTYREKADADLIRRGDFRELVRRNYERGF